MAKLAKKTTTHRSKTRQGSRASRVENRKVTIDRAVEEAGQYNEGAENLATELNIVPDYAPSRTNAVDLAEDIKGYPGLSRAIKDWSERGYTDAAIERPHIRIHHAQTGNTTVAHLVVLVDPATQESVALAEIMSPASRVVVAAHVKETTPIEPVVYTSMKIEGIAVGRIDQSTKEKAYQRRFIVESAKGIIRLGYDQYEAVNAGKTKTNKPVTYEFDKWSDISLKADQRSQEKETPIKRKNPVKRTVVPEEVSQLNDALHVRVAASGLANVSGGEHHAAASTVAPGATPVEAVVSGRSVA